MSECWINHYTAAPIISDDFKISTKLLKKLDPKNHKILIIPGIVHCRQLGKDGKFSWNKNGNPSLGILSHKG